MSDDNNQYKRFYLEWWNIKRSTIRNIVAFFVIIGVMAAGGWWAWKSNILSQIENSEIPTDAGRIVSFEGDVRIVRANTRDTIVVTKSTYVMAGDTIQTQSDGRAQVEMIDGSILSVRPNSTVVVRDSSSIFGGKNVKVALDDGQINVRTEDQNEGTNNVVVVKETENKLLSQTDASFNANASSNGGEIRISRGGVETSANGEKVLLKENEYAAVNSGKIESKEKLLAPPSLDMPQNLAQFTDRGYGARADFKWSPVGGVAIASYVLQVSKSATFSADGIIVDRDKFIGQTFTLQNLSPGTYYWRLRSLAASGQLSNWSEPSRFIVAREAGASEMSITEIHVQPIGGGVYLFEGKSQAGTIVKAAGRETFAGSDGSFKLQINASGADVGLDLINERGDRVSYLISLRNGSFRRR